MGPCGNKSVRQQVGAATSRCGNRSVRQEAAPHVSQHVAVAEGCSGGHPGEVCALGSAGYRLVLIERLYPLKGCTRVMACTRSKAGHAEGLCLLVVSRLAVCHLVYVHYTAHLEVVQDVALELLIQVPAAERLG